MPAETCLPGSQCKCQQDGSLAKCLFLSISMTQINSNPHPLLGFLHVLKWRRAVEAPCATFSPVWWVLQQERFSRGGDMTAALPRIDRRSHSKCTTLWQKGSWHCSQKVNNVINTLLLVPRPALQLLAVTLITAAVNPVPPSALINPGCQSLLHFRSSDKQNQVIC